MDYSGEAAERIVRISIDGMVAVVKITGEGAKRIAVFIHAALSDQNKLSGAVKLISMLKSGKELKVFTLTDEDFELFKSEVKRFGVTYCILRDVDRNPATPVEFMVKAEDASKIQRIFERLGFGQVDASDIEAEIEERLNGSSQDAPEQAEIALTRDIDALSAPIQARAEKEVQQENPLASKTSPFTPSGHTSGRQGTEGKAPRVSMKKVDRKSVKQEIAEIKNERAEKAIQGKDAPFTKEEQRYFRRSIPLEMQTSDAHRNPRNAK